VCGDNAEKMGCKQKKSKGVLSLSLHTGVQRDGRDYGNTYIATSNTFPLGAGLT